MGNFIPKSSTHSKAILTTNIHDGQFIITTDQKEIYYDNGTSRIKLSDYTESTATKTTAESAQTKANEADATASTALSSATDAISRLGTIEPKVTSLETTTSGLDSRVTALESGGGSGVKKYTALIGNGSATTIDVTHNLNTEDITVRAYDATSKASLWLAYTITNANSISITFTTAPAASSIKVVVLG